MLSSHSGKILVVIIIIFTVKKFVQASGMENEIAVSSQTTIWSEIGRIVSFLLDKCLINDIKDLNQLHRSNQAAVVLKRCFKRRGLRALDRALSRDIIAITDNIALVKRKNDTGFHDKGARTWVQQIFRKAKFLNGATNWNVKVLEKIVHFLKTRIVRITFYRFDNITNVQNEARRKHKENNDLGQMLMFGLVAAGLIVIPMGFQFLAVLGGKALLLAKLALILTSIQGLKKIATSNVNYGLYSTGHTEPWHYDRQWLHDGDSYPSSYYPPGVASPIADHYAHSSPLPPIYQNFNPRGEDYLST